MMLTNEIQVSKRNNFFRFVCCSKYIQHQPFKKVVNKNIQYYKKKWKRLHEKIAKPSKLRLF